MAYRTPAIVCLIAALLHLSLALQVTPDSPCASFCLDSSNLNKSDPNSSTTNGRDIACNDDDFGDTPEGQKYQRCLSCLQDSTHQQGGENDQNWFLYNLRYSFDYCIFGYPNATDVGSNPCITSEACGPLEDALKEGILDPEHQKTYDYCEVDNGAMLGDSYDRCLACVRADYTHLHVSNFLVALEAGCLQQPLPNITIGLNDTVFSQTMLGIIDPSTSSDSDSNNRKSLSTPAIVGISIGALAVVLLAAGCAYMQYRRRKNRFARTRRELASPLSFQCRTHVTPRAPTFARDDESTETEEAPYMDPSQALSSNPVPEGAPWNSQNAMSGLRTNPKLTNITTTLPCPPPVHSSPRMVSPDDYTTPTSTTSTRSNAPLLHHKPYNPADHAVSPSMASPPLCSPGFGIANPRESSPIAMHHPPLRERTPQDPTTWNEQRPVGSGRNLMRKKSPWGMTAPVEVMSIQTSFAPPPKRGF